jgi:SAM-dependent methyltransferase
MGTRRALEPFIRLFYRNFYNRFAFTYDLISSIVSRGEWNAWTRAAIPFLRNPPDPTLRILEIAFGTGNLLLDLTDAGYLPVGVDLSPYMISITERKLKNRGMTLHILRATVQRLPFLAAHFDSVIMTFPPGFATDSSAMQEIQRVLAGDGRLIWVDAPYLYPRSLWARILNWAYQLTGSRTPPPDDRVPVPNHQPSRQLPKGDFDWLPTDGWSWNIHRIEQYSSYVHVIIGTKLSQQTEPQTALRVQEAAGSKI